MSVAAVRKEAMSSFLFPRHMAPMLMKPVTRTEVPVRPYHEICGFVRMSGREYPDLLDVLRMSVADYYEFGRGGVLSARRFSEMFAPEASAE